MRIIWQKPDNSISITIPNEPMLANETEEAYLNRIAQKVIDGGGATAWVRITEEQMDVLNNSPENIAYLKSLKLNALKACTRDCITSDSPNEKRMPEWRQTAWRYYAYMYDKKAGGGTLSAWEQSNYDDMIAVGETELSVYNDVIASLNWIRGCRTANNIMEAEIEACTTKEQLDAIDVTRCPYPAWEGWGIAKAYISGENK